VDAPGYGFAKGDQKDLKSWGAMMQRYLKSSQNIRYVYTLIDAEHGYVYH
jgi:GTP-binding protein